MANPLQAFADARPPRTQDVEVTCYGKASTFTIKRLTYAELAQFDSYIIDDKGKPNRGLDGQPSLRPRRIAAALKGVNEGLESLDWQEVSNWDMEEIRALGDAVDKVNGINQEEAAKAAEKN